MVNEFKNLLIQDLLSNERINKRFINNGNIYTGNPSIVLPARPFFSIIIPCYNSKKEYITELLESIKAQNMSNEIEVCIVDDCSMRDDFIGVALAFADELSIRFIKTEQDSIHCPGNSREVGVSIVEGRWIIFADHDDLFIPNTFRSVKKAIIDNKEENLLFCNFKEVDPIDTNKVLKEVKDSKNWMHAKFYNLDNFWKKYNVHFKKDLESHEDIYVSTLTKCIAHDNNIKPCCIDLFCYLWRADPESTSRKRYNENGELFIFNYFEHYIISTMEVYLTHYKELDEPHKALYRYWYWANCIDCILYQYFYYCGFVNRFGCISSSEIKDLDDELIEKLDYRFSVAKKYYEEFLDVFNENCMSILSIFKDPKRIRWYAEVKKSAEIGVGPILEYTSFPEYLHWITL